MEIRGMKKYTKSSCLKCGQTIHVPNPAWLRSERQLARITLREFGRKIGKSAPYISDVELGRRRCTEKMLNEYVKLIEMYAH